MVNKQTIILTPELSEEMGSSSLFPQKNPTNYNSEEPFNSYFGYLHLTVFGERKHIFAKENPCIKPAEDKQIHYIFQL